MVDGLGQEVVDHRIRREDFQQERSFKSAQRRAKKTKRFLNPSFESRALRTRLYGISHLVTNNAGIHHLMTTICWFRNDLRIGDNPALGFAAAMGWWSQSLSLSRLSGQ